MKHEDAQLVHRTLAGDAGAFATLVKKHQKRVHALAWRKVGDFHIAEELAQDTFLKAYEKLGTLKNPSQFAGWLYVITNRLCIAWHRKQKSPMESLETTSGEEIEEMSYRHYEDEAREKASVEHRRERVNALLEKLPESERTVVTLHYLGEMTSKAIGEFLGVSPNTVRSRLQRARHRLLQEEEDMIRETLGNVRLSTTFTENIVRQIADIKPASPTGSRPLVPVALSAATAMIIFLIMGVGSEYLARFQKPYNLNARSEMTVEIIDAPIVLDTKAKPDLRNQAGRFDTTGKSSGTGPQVSEPVMLAAAQVEKEPRPSTDQQWIQTNGPEETRSVSALLVSSWGDVYAVSRIGIYRLTPDTSAWTLVSPNFPKVPVGDHGVPMLEQKGVLYIVFPDSVFASKDRGETWTKLGERPKGPAVGIVITDDAFYLAVRDEGIFRSIDGGKRWTSLNQEVTDSGIRAIAAVENTVFVGTNRGLYRFHSQTWEKLPIDTTKAIVSLSVSESNLYVGTGADISQLDSPEGMKAHIEELMGNINSNTRSWEVFHSIDLGNSWTDITPTSKSPMMRAASSVKVLAAGDAVLVLGMISFRSTDGGKTWTEFGYSSETLVPNSYHAVAVDENTIFKTGPSELKRSTDGGASWHSFTDGLVGTSIFNLTAFKNEFYTSTPIGIFKSPDNGDSWEKLPMNSGELTLNPTEKFTETMPVILPRLAIADNVLYGIASTVVPEHTLRIFRLSTNGNVLVPLQEIPSLNGPSMRNIMDWVDISRTLERFSGAFAVSGETFYVEYTRKLLRWKRGESAWFDTGLIDTSERSNKSADFMKGFKLAVSEAVVYVGKRDSSLFQSLDSGNRWKDLTPNLPLRFERFNDIVFAGSTVYVATDAGVLTSEDGDDWHAITDKMGTHTIIDRMAVAGMAVYGAGDGGIYQLNSRSEWEKTFPEVPDSVISLVINSDRLYIATEHRGMFHVSLEKE